MGPLVLRQEHRAISLKSCLPVLSPKRLGGALYALQILLTQHALTQACLSAEDLISPARAHALGSQAGHIHVLHS